MFGGLDFFTYLCSVLKKLEIMKESKKELEKAILVIAESLNIKESFETLLKNMGIHSTVKELTYVLFAKNNQQYFEHNDNVFNAISLVRKYCQEMDFYGEVNFECSYNRKCALSWWKSLGDDIGDIADKYHIGCETIQVHQIEEIYNKEKNEKYF
jgi:hypothetical protein